MASFADAVSPIANIVRKEFTLLLADEQPRDRAAAVATHKGLHRVALESARQAVFRLRGNAEERY